MLSKPIAPFAFLYNIITKILSSGRYNFPTKSGILSLFHIGELSITRETQYII